MKRLGLCVLLSVFVVAGCSGPMMDVSQKFDKAADFGAYKTFAWMEGVEVQNVKAGGGRDIDLDKEIKDAVTRVLDERGYVLVNVDPDILLSYHTGLAKTYYTNSFGYRYWEKVGWSETETVQDGQLTIDFVDRKKDMVFWRGTAQIALNVDPTETMIRKNINNAVKKILDQYPPDPRKDAGGF